ncbi:hypothetical protein QVD17_28219 [Tagetes erecta]|uniref:SHSP domain-containing protein n=1 Tax=Tagetes erecta TaxID=13708 RepID=A0AAD8KA26_TARER|nr:hypothetical protein QVD17_28219 [Tagetes erecta]
MAFFSRLLTTAASTTLLLNNKLLSPPVPLRSTVSLIRRGFNTQLNSSDDEADTYFYARSGDGHISVHSKRKLRQIFDAMDESKNKSSMDGEGSAVARKKWDIKDDDEFLNLRFEVPGLEKGDLKVTVEKNVLVMKLADSSAQYDMPGKVVLQPGLHKMTGIKAEMKNGVLKIVVPKFKPDERKDLLVEVK